MLQREHRDFTRGKKQLNDDERLDLACTVIRSRIDEARNHNIDLQAYMQQCTEAPDQSDSKDKVVYWQQKLQKLNHQIEQLPISLDKAIKH